MRPDTCSAAALTLVLALAPAAAADVVACPPSTPPGVVCLSGNVSDTAGGGPLMAGVVYRVGVINVPLGETLTVDPGAIVKVTPSARIEVRGTLNAGAGAVLTSIADDTVGGDTNGDGAVSLPQRGDWETVVFFAQSDASTLDGVELRFAETGVLLQSADITLSDVTIEECSRAALDLFSSSVPIVAGCSFQNNHFAVDRVTLRSLPSFLGNSAGGNDMGDYLHVTETTMVADLVISPLNSFGNEAFVVCPRITVPAGLTLELLPGTVVKFGTGPNQPYAGCNLGGVVVQGTLLAGGTTFTSVDDDSVAGDTRRDGFTLGVPGDWGTLELEAGSDASVLLNCTLSYGGATTLAPFIAPALDLNLADVTLQGVTVAACAGSGMRLRGNSYPTVSGCAFDGNFAQAVEGVPLGAVPGFSGNTGANNGGDYLEVAGGTVLGELGWTAANALNADGLFVLVSDVAVDGDASWTLHGGVVIKWTAPDNHVLQVDGTLVTGTGGGPVVFTVLTDDEVLGDSNLDGGLSQPQPGDWTGLSFGPGSSASVLDEAVVRYAGNPQLTQAAVSLSAAHLTIIDTVVESSESAALDLMQDSFPAVSGCTFQDNERAVIRAPIAAVPGFSANLAGGNAQGDFLEITQGDVSVGGPGAPGCAVAIGPQNALLPDRVFVVSDDIDVPVSCLLSVLAGSVVKWHGAREFDVDGSVQVGGLGDPVVFTSIDDDSVGGDTLGDGFTEGAPGDWRDVFVSAPGSSFNGVIVRFAGLGSPAIELAAADAVLHDVQVLDCAGDALDLNGSSFPQMDGCAFERNGGVAVQRVPIGALPGFSGNSAEQNAGGDFLRITSGVVPATLLVDASQSLNGGPFVVATDVTVIGGSELTLIGGVVIKFEGPRRVGVEGLLDVVGSASVPAVLTSLADDTAGDTNGDAGASAPAPGDWVGLEFGDGADASQVVGLRVRYAGAAGNPAVRLWKANAQLLDTCIEHSGGAGVHLSNNSFPDLRRARIDDGQGFPIDFAPLSALPGLRHNSAAGNTPGDVVRVTSANVSATPVIERDNALNADGVFLVDTAVHVLPGATLELRQGTIFKWKGAFRTLTAEGTLIVEGTGYEPVTFSSASDDAVGGDTEKDGAATSPAPGDWNQFRVFGAAPGSRIEHLLLRYGGASPASIELDAEQLSARALRVEHSATDGIRAKRHAGDAQNWVAYQCAGDGICLQSGAFDLVHATVSACGGAGVHKQGGHTGALRNSISHDNAGGGVTGFDPGEVFTSDVGPGFEGVDGNIDADPLFFDEANGDLSLTLGSPCIDAADLSVAVATVKDQREAPRLLDHDLDGQLGADMGAFERAAYELAVGGEPRVGTLMSFTALGAQPGIAVFLLGDLSGTTLLRPFGFSLYAAVGDGHTIGAAPTGTALQLPVPHPSTSVGEWFGVQALVRPLPANGGASALRSGPGNLSRVWRGRVLE